MPALFWNGVCIQFISAASSAWLLSTLQWHLMGGVLCIAAAAEWAAAERGLGSGGRPAMGWHGHRQERFPLEHAREHGLGHRGGIPVLRGARVLRPHPEARLEHHHTGAQPAGFPARRTLPSTHMSHGRLGSENGVCTAEQELPSSMRSGFCRPADVACRSAACCACQVQSVRPRLMLYSLQVGQPSNPQCWCGPQGS